MASSVLLVAVSLLCFGFHFLRAVLFPSSNSFFLFVVLGNPFSFSCFLLQKNVVLIHPFFFSFSLQLEVLFFPPQCGLYSSFRAHNKAARLSPVDPGISRGGIDLYSSRGYAHPVTRDRGITQLAKQSLIKVLFSRCHS